MNDPDTGPVFAKNGKLYSAKQPDKEVAIENVISADGWNTTLKLITANQSMPGPPIFLYENQKITIIVQNNLLNEAITIHWHGIDQLGWPAMDGVAFVTQCPILPGQYFNYTFQPRFSGTYWYHSHVGNQRDMGLFGAFIVLEHNEVIPIKNQHLVMLQEWNHLYGSTTMLKANLERAFIQPHSILINGKGDFENNNAPLQVYEVNRHFREKHLFRIIGVGSKGPLLFSVPGIPLKVKATDGYPVRDKQVDKIIIYPAERYDIELNLDRVTNYKPEYNITVHSLEGIFLEKQKNIIGRGLIKITSSSTSVYTWVPTYGLTVLNCPFELYFREPTYVYRCIPVSSLTSLPSKKKFDLLKRSHESFTYFLNFGFPGKTEYSSINGRKFIWPTVSALSQSSELDTSCDECNNENSCKCTHSLTLKSGAEIIMVLSNIGNGASISHPIHIHGHTFEVLKMGFPSLSPQNSSRLDHNNDLVCNSQLANDASECNDARWRNLVWWLNYTLIPGINLYNPVRKDTVIVPYGGYTIIRYWATNPGVWFMHCHIDKHMVEGMALMLNESFENLHDLPKDMPTCHSFKNHPIVGDEPPRKGLLINIFNSLMQKKHSHISEYDFPFKFKNCRMHLKFIIAELPNKVIIKKKIYKIFVLFLFV